MRLAAGYDARVGPQFGNQPAHNAIDHRARIKPRLHAGHGVVFNQFFRLRKPTNGAVLLNKASIEMRRMPAR